MYFFIINLIFIQVERSLLPYLAQFSNEEFKMSFELVCSRLEGEVFTVEDVQQAYENATEYISELEILRADSGPHPLTASIVEKRDLRHDFLSSLKGRVTYFLKSPIAGERNASQLLNTWLNRFSKSYSRPSILKQTEMVDNMLKDIAQSAPLSSALELLGLLATLDSIQSVNTELKELHEAREIERRARILKAKEVRSVAYDKMKMLWTTIETAIKLQKGNIDKHLEFFRIINFAISNNKILNLKSSTRRKNAAQKAEEEMENAAHENGVHINSTNGDGENRSMRNFVPMNGVEAHNEMPTQQAAMRSKTINGGAVGTIPVNGNQGHDTAVMPDIVNADHSFAKNDSDRES